MGDVTLIYGEPCTGKSTLARAVLATGAFRFVPDRWVAHHEDEMDGTILLGRYDDEEHQFPGTDRLSMAVAPYVKEELRERWRDRRVVIEGARLATGAFAQAVIHTIRMPIRFGRTEVREDLLLERRLRERTQKLTFLKAQASKVRNLSGILPQLHTALPMETEEDLWRAVDWVRGPAVPLPE